MIPFSNQDFFSRTLNYLIDLVKFEKLVKSMTDSISHLLHESGQESRAYTKIAATDGVITYSYTDDSFRWIDPIINQPWREPTRNPSVADDEQSRWIDGIFNYLDKLTGVRFRKSEGERGEMHLNFVPTNHCKFMNGSHGDCKTSVVNNEADGGNNFVNGYGQMWEFHNQEQYGGLMDIRSIQRTIMEILGITEPNGNGDDPEYNTDDTLLSFNQSPTDVAGSIFFFTEDDQLALKNLLGENLNEVKRKKKKHKQKYKEQLMIGLDGIIDTFNLTSKGMILKEDQGTQFDDVGVVINNYYMPYISNFNPYEGDRIKIHRSLLDRKSPILKKSRKLSKKYKNVELEFNHVWSDGGDYRSGANVYYNDAGKIYIDINGTKSGLVTNGNKAGLNSQAVAFVDPVGPSTNTFLGEWLSFFG